MIGKDSSRVLERRLEDHFWEEKILKDIASSRRIKLSDFDSVFCQPLLSANHRGSKSAAEVVETGVRIPQALAAKSYCGTTCVKNYTVIVSYKGNINV